MTPAQIAYRLTYEQRLALIEAARGEHLAPERRDLLTQPGVYWDPFEYCPALLVESWAGGIRHSPQHVTIVGRAVAEALT